ncbi:Six-hairpin glycosidase-like protein [Phyllosticta citribraziliensis]|uniref:Six-hairpin glycosidase-like protein n=1 Tax=Phyllosticta citribraziliensis TaxID=989973 RepID=A0ABR1L568_9PEZI
MSCFLALVRALVLSSLLTGTRASADTEKKYSVWMANSIISRGQGVLTGEGDSSALLQAGFTQKGFRRLLEQYSGDSSAGLIEGYVNKSVDSTISTVSVTTKLTNYPLDRLSNGNNLIDLFLETGDATYRQSFESLRESINLQPRNVESGLWYYTYKNWSYLDGMYSLAPFYSYYTGLFDQDNTTAIADIVLQLDLLWEHCYDNATGLLFHGYDESKTAVWANPETGASPHVWGRALGWYFMALVDTLELLPVERQSEEWTGLLDKFRTLACAVVQSADEASGAWWQLLDQPGREGNYIESSASAMFVYALLKGERLGFFESATLGTDSPNNDVEISTNASGDNEMEIVATSTSHAQVADKAYDYILHNFVVHNGNGTLSYNGTVGVCSLNSTASYEYYVQRPINYDSVLGSVAFILASLEHEIKDRE